MKKVVFFYDNWCPRCTKFAKTVALLDWLKLLDIKKLRDIEHESLFIGIDFNLAKKQMASYTTRWNYGFKTIYIIFARIPICFLFVPFLFLLQITGLGQHFYVQLAIHRKIIPLHCDTESCEI
jgi:predicted DCC family thiol-disulfide oxidoreductase YuxK